VGETVVLFGWCYFWQALKALDGSLPVQSGGDIRAFVLEMSHNQIDAHKNF